MNRILAGLFIAVALIHLFPVVGVLSAERLQGLYGVAIEDPNLEILMRHRAILLGIVGGFVLAAAFRPRYRLAASVAAFVSMLSYLALVAAVGEFGEPVRRVALVDGVACILLLAAWLLPGAREHNLRSEGASACRRPDASTNGLSGR